MRPEDREPLGLLLAWLALCALSAIRPHDHFTWFLEVLPVFLALAALLPTYRRFRFTPLAYRLIFLHACVLTLGAHYTYALVPAGEWVQEVLGLERNHYDRLGHFVQGFFPAVIVREVLLRTSPLRVGRWLFFLVTCVCLAFSAFYELIEWWMAVAADAKDFVGSQGDVWDAQWDMFLCLCGALLSQLLLGRAHDRQLAAQVAAATA